MKLLTGLFRIARKRTITKDNDLGQFRAKLEELVSSKDELSDDDVSKRVEELKAMTSDLPDGDDKSKLELFIEDFKAIKEQDEATAKEAASMVADLFEKLDTEAMKDAPKTDGEGSREPPENTEGAKETVTETVPPEGKETKDEGEGALSEYTLEEIFQYVKKRLTDKADAGDGGEKVEEEKEKEEEEKDEVVTDHAPRIPVTMNDNTAAEGSLAEMFNNFKKGGR